ncbi:translocon-associated protein subunit delta [Episyrphus balteatus]|uniref:translocon-associated protein subunit delta n=1 Tax=Episyrphus balteatus TaxID=286459 RepID=UPI0024865BAC|nr:translocon-associated protein subunit delta [Episyrphus balteatus]
MSKNLCIALIVVICASASLAATCSSPKVTVSSFSTTDATILTQLAHVGEFTLKCSNGEKPQLFAEFECGKVVPVARVGDDKYQISWTEDAKKGSSGSKVIRLFDEEGYSSIRKAQRDGDKVASVKSLTDITISVPKAYSGPWVNSELVAALVAAFVSHFAFTTKSKLQA